MLETIDSNNQSLTSYHVSLMPLQFLTFYLLIICFPCKTLVLHQRWLVKAWCSSCGIVLRKVIINHVPLLKARPWLGVHRHCFNSNGGICSSAVVWGTSPWCGGKCVRCDAGRSKVRLSAGSYQDLANWYCSPLARRTVYGRTAGNTTRTAGNTTRTQKKPSENEPRVQTQTWRYKTIVVIKRQQQTHHI